MRSFTYLLRSQLSLTKITSKLIEQIAGKDISERIAHFAQVEADLITSDDSDFKIP
ncbi:tRNA isopentenyl-2-thiomethyl-A-37 hydroxylase MiaE [Vibrio chagasii]|nr:tRNA isopentenyl-2-thiomethyl-A-37 hydroxylase MiaE [Vibrio chagasii]